MIHAAVFKTIDPAERATLVVTGSPEQIARNTPKGGCWRQLPVGAATGELPTLGALPPLSCSEGRQMEPSTQA